MSELRTLQVKPVTKERFLKLGNMSDTQDSVLVRLLDFYDEYTGKVQQLEEDNKQMIAQMEAEWGR